MINHVTVQGEMGRRKAYDRLLPSLDFFVRKYNAIRHAMAFYGKSPRLPILCLLSTELYAKTIKGADLSSSQRELQLIRPPSSVNWNLLRICIFLPLALNLQQVELFMEAKSYRKKRSFSCLHQHFFGYKAHANARYILHLLKLFPLHQPLSMLDPYIFLSTPHPLRFFFFTSDFTF